MYFYLFATHQGGSRATDSTHGYRSRYDGRDACRWRASICDRAAHAERIRHRFGRLLSDEQRANIETRAESLDSKYSVPVYIAIVPNFSDQEPAKWCQSTLANIEHNDKVILYVVGYEDGTDVYCVGNEMARLIRGNVLTEGTLRVHYRQPVGHTSRPRSPPRKQLRAQQPSSATLATPTTRPRKLPPAARHITRI